MTPEDLKSILSRSALAETVELPGEVVCELVRLASGHLTEWIPVAVRYPEGDGTYLVWHTPSHGSARLRIMDYFDGDWWLGKGAPPTVTHWLPLPPPPRSPNEGEGT